MAATAEKIWLDDFAANRPDLPGAGLAWLEARRSAAITAFVEHGIPHRRVEAWKYTDLRARLAAAYEPATPWIGPIADAGAMADPFRDIDAWRAVFVDGFFRADLSSLPKKGVALTTFAADVPAWAEAYLGAVRDPADHVFSALNLALMRDGVALRLTKGQRLDKPLILAFRNMPRAGHALAMHIRNLIVLEEGAEATILETHLGASGAEMLANHVADIVVGPNARLRHVRLQAEAATASNIGTLNIAIERAGFYDGFYVTTGAALSRTEARIRIAGEGGEARLNGLTLIGHGAHADTTTLVEHMAPRGKSEQVFKSVLGVKARGVYQGKVLVAEGANGTDSHQLAKAVLLSLDAEADAKPELEIYADDVKCGHGAATGELDENQLFYLRSRGVPEDEARGMLIEAFLVETVERLGDNPIAHAVGAFVQPKIFDLGVAA